MHRPGIDFWANGKVHEADWLVESASRQILSRTIFIGRWQMADGSWGERPELPAWQSEG